MNHPNISFIIPIRNSIKTIENCLKSIYNQKTSLSYEVIIVDNGSTDGSFQWLSSFCKNNEDFTLIKEENQGASYARNKGINFAKAEYIAFIDSDVVLDNRWLEEIYFYTKKENLDCAQGFIQRAPINKKSRLIDSYRRKNLNYSTHNTGISLFNSKGKARPFINTAACLYKKSTLNKAGRFFHYTASEDFELSLRVHLLGGRLGATSLAKARVYFMGGILDYCKKVYYWSISDLEFERNWKGINHKQNQPSTRLYCGREKLLFLLFRFIRLVGKISGHFYIKKTMPINSYKFLLLTGIKSCSPGNIIINHKAY